MNIILPIVLCILMLIVNFAKDGRYEPVSKIMFASIALSAGMYLFNAGVAVVVYLVYCYYAIWGCEDD